MSEDNKTLIIVIAIVVVIVLIAIYSMIMEKKMKGKAHLKKAKQEEMFKKLFNFFSNNFLTQGALLKIYNSLASLSIYTRPELQMLASKYFLTSTGISLGLIILALVLFKDTISVLIATAFALLVNNVTVTKYIDKTNSLVHKAMKYSLASIRQEYMKTNSIPESIAEADIHPLLRKPMDEIYQILTSTDSEVRLMKFYESSPFRPLQTFAGIAYNINNSGDSKDEHGQYNFINAISILTSDINAELERITMMKSKFGIIEYLSFVPIFLMNIIEGYFVGIMPGTAMIYNGMLGYLGRVITLLCCIFSYKIITGINSVTPIKEDDRVPFTSKLLQKPAVYNFIWNITPKNAARRKLQRKLKLALSRKSPEHIYVEKIAYSSVAFILGLVITLSIVSLGREFTITSTQQLSLIASDEMDAYTSEQILEMDFAYFQLDYELTVDQKIAFVKGYMPTLTDLQAQDQVSRMEDKLSMMNNAYFHWYYMLIIIAITCVAWFIPEGTLKLRENLISTEADDDFLQLQTLMAILLNTNCDTIDALWQLTEHSRIHKDMLMYAYHSYPSNPEKEIERLMSKTPIIDFKRFLGKLKLTISDLSLAETYSDLKTEREHIMKTRQTVMEETIDKKRSLCGPISLIPIGALVVFELLIPIGYLGIKEFTAALDSMNNM